MFIRRPLRFVTTDETGGNTEVKKSTAEMTPEERIAFEEGAKRKYQDKLKAFNGKTPEDVARMEQELERIRQEKLTEQERAVEEARVAARTEALAEASAVAVDTALSVALRGRSADAAALLNLDRSVFVVEGRVDAEKLTKWVDENTTVTGEKRPPVKIGQGDFEKLEVSDRATGEAEAQKRFGAKK